jgi:mRNA interferase MazF
VSAPARGEVWLADLNPVRGHEQVGRRPVLVVSEDLFNQGPAGLAIVLPMTSTVRNVPSQVLLSPPDGGVRSRSAILCEAVRSVSVERLVARWGAVGRQTMASVEDRLRILLRL